jgi:hypothetical protein
MVDIAGLIREAKLPERVVHICLRLDLVHRYEELSAQLSTIKEKYKDSLGVEEDAVPVQNEMTALEEEMRAATVSFTLRALSRPRFRALLAEHPPRKDDDGQVLAADWMGVNTATFYGVLIRRATIEPVLDEETWTLLLEEKLTDRQYDGLAEAAWDLCRDKVDLPFSLTG